MSKRQWLSIMGVWVIIVPFLGFLEFWNQIIAAVSGLVIVAISYNLPPENRKSGGPGSVFVENSKSDNTNQT